MMRCVACEEGATHTRVASPCTAHQRFVATLWKTSCDGRRVLTRHRLAHPESKP